MTNETRSYGVIDGSATATIADAHAERIRLAGFTILENRIPTVDLARTSQAIDDVMDRQAQEAGGWEKLTEIGEQSTARCCLAYDDVFLELATDPLVTPTTDPSLLPLDEVIERADLLIIAAPHREYRELTTDLPVVDIWNLQGNGVRT